jgi:hypothetical protein
MIPGERAKDKKRGWLIYMHSVQNYDDYSVLLVDPASPTELDEAEIKVKEHLEAQLPVVEEYM